jgi:hydrogenase expression/formation protein HypC
MCLAVPGKILGIDGDTARVDFGGITREANVILVPEAAVDSYVLVHAGFAIQVLNEAEAKETLSLFRQLAEALDNEDERGAGKRNAAGPEHDVGDDAERGGA